MPIPVPNKNNDDDFTLPPVDNSSGATSINYDKDGRVVNPYDNNAENSVEEDAVKVVSYEEENNEITEAPPIFNAPSTNDPYQRVNPNLNNEEKDGEDLNNNSSATISNPQQNIKNNMEEDLTNSANIISEDQEILNDDHNLKENSKIDMNKNKKFKGKKTLNNSQDTFIDTKNKKLKPFGRKTKTVNVADVDDRKDLGKRNNILRYVVITLLTLTTLLGLYKVIVPPKTLDADDVKAVINQQTNNTGFPLDRGRGFATDFMSAFLQTDNKNVNALQALGYFYSGGKLQSNDSPIRNFSNIKQSVLYGPTVYESKALTSYSANYTVGAYVLVTNPDGSVVQPTSNPTSKTSAAQTSNSNPSVNSNATAQWTFFSVNVYYDKEKDSMVIAPDSPTVVPPVGISNVGDVPNQAKIGTGSGSDQLNSDIKGVVYGFMKAYQSSTANEHTELDQYIISNPPKELLNGLGGRYEIDGGVDNIKYTSFTTDDSSIVKAQVIVLWREGANSNSSLTYKSTYVMTLQKQSNGKYLVTKFAPQLYFEGEK